jgi:site-specific DNA-methyltransferase (adenine-specific)
MTTSVEQPVTVNEARDSQIAEAKGGSLHGFVRRQFGDCTLIMADCLDVLPIEADAVITDPPYGIGYIHSGKCKGRWHRINVGEIMHDDRAFDPSPWLGYANVVLFGANHYAAKLPEGGWHVWDKLGGGKPFGDSFSDAEFVWHNQKAASRIFRYMWKGICVEGGTAPKRIHPSQKPVPLMAWLMDLAKVPLGATVLDPYMGSGTTAIACIRTGRKFVGIEKDEKHFEAACERVTNELAQGVLLPPNDKAHLPARKPGVGRQENHE